MQADKAFYKRADFLLKLFDSFPLPVLVVDPEVKVQLLNRAATAAFDLSNEAAYENLGGDILSCFYAGRSGGCGRDPACSQCVVRESVAEAAKGTAVLRRKTVMGFIRGGEVAEAQLLVTAAPLSYEGKTFVVITLEDISELLQLRSLLPICAGCKKIRNEKDYWESVEKYFKASLDLDFTHSICPECIAKLYPELAEDEGSDEEGRGP